MPLENTVKPPTGPCSRAPPPKMQHGHELSCARQRRALYMACLEQPHGSGPAGTSFVSLQCVPRPLRSAHGESPSLWLGDELSEHPHSYGAPAAGQDAPDELCCPISFTIMSDPVLASDGAFYELHALFAWLDSVAARPGGPCAARSPLTNEAVSHIVFRVRAKRQQVDRWVLDSGHGGCVAAWGDAYVRNVVGVYLAELRRVRKLAAGCRAVDRMGRLFFWLFSDAASLCGLDTYEACTGGQISAKRYSYMQAISRLNALRSDAPPEGQGIRMVRGAFTPAWLQEEMRFFGLPRP